MHQIYQNSEISRNPVYQHYFCMSLSVSMIFLCFLITVYCIMLHSSRSNFDKDDVDFNKII